MLLSILFHIHDKNHFVADSRHLTHFRWLRLFVLQGW